MVYDKASAVVNNEICVNILKDNPGPVKSCYLIR